MTDQPQNLSERALRIAHIDAESGFSGGEVQVFLLMEGLRSLGLKNLLLAPPGSRALETAKARGFETAAIRMKSDLDLLAVPKISLALRRWQADLAHLHTGRATWLGGLAASRSGVPAITTRRMDRPVKRNWRNRKIHTKLTCRSIAISDAVADCLREGGVDPARVQVIPSSVDPGSLEPSRSRTELRAELGVSEDEVLLLALASLVPRKGLDLLLDALADLRSETRWRLLIGGEGPERSNLERRAAALGERVRFLGRREDKADLLTACDVFCLPSRAEGLGVAALEAMACGRPVLATRVGGLGQAVLHEGTGLLVEPGQPAALRDALERLLDDAELRHRLGEAGPSRVAMGYSAAQMTSSYEKLYREVLESMAPPEAAR